MAVIKRGKIIRADLALWDGATKTYSRPDATGSTVTGVTVGDFVDVLQVFGDGTSYTDATIVSALNAIGTSNNMTLLWSAGTWTINDSHTVPANVANHIAGGCVFSILSGKTMTFSGPVHVEFSTSTGTGWYTGDGVVSCTLGASGFPGW